MITHSKGIVNNDNAVDKKTISTASLESPLYFSAKMAVVLPAGIPANTVATEVTNGGNEAKVHPAKTTSGIIINRINL